MEDIIIVVLSTVTGLLVMYALMDKAQKEDDFNRRMDDLKYGGTKKTGGCPPVELSDSPPKT